MRYIRTRIRKNTAQILAVFILVYYFMLFPIASYAQQLDEPGLSVPMVDESSETITPPALPSPAELSPAISPTSLPTPTDIPHVEQTSKQTSVPELPAPTPVKEVGILDKVSNILLKKISSLTQKKTRLKKLDKDTFNVNDPITIEATSLGSTEALSITVTSAEGEKFSLEAHEEIIDNNQTLVVEEPRNLKPGKYTLSITDGSELAYSDEFYWGVLTLNTNKATYVKDETAHIAIAVLDEFGDMVCDANVTLTVTAPSGKTIVLSTENASIVLNDVCSKKEFTLIPDYEAQLKVSDIGTYALHLSAETKKGTYEIEDAFDVKESVLFDVERTSATRLYPPLTYPMTISVTANQDFEGIITDVVPEVFDVSQASGVRPYAYVKKSDENPAGSVLGISIPDLIQPYEGFFETSLHFGEQYGFDSLVKLITNKNELRGHDGMDIDMPIGTHIYAVDDGKITYADVEPYGKTIIIEHSWGSSYYGHLSDFKVKVGENVKKGDHIGESGNTGVSTGAHLHFGIKPKDTNVDNGYNGFVNPEEYVSFESQAKVLGATTAVENSPTKKITWNVSLKKGETIKLGYSYKSPLESPELYKLGKLTFVEQDLSDEELAYATNLDDLEGFSKIRETAGFKQEMKKAQIDAIAETASQSSSEGKIVYTEGRFWQLAVDSVVVSGTITAAEAEYGGLQRKLAYVNSNWYVFYEDGTDIFYKKSSDGVSWGSPVNFDASEDNDADNYNPSIGVSGNFIHVFYMDESADQVQGMRLDTSTDTTTQTSVCALASPGAFTVTSYMVTVASISASSAIVTYSDTSSGTNEGAFEVTGLDAASCAGTALATGNILPATPQFGWAFSDSDRPVAVPLTSTTAGVVYQDGNLSWSVYDASLDEWQNQDTTIAAITDSEYSVTTDGTNIWVLTRNGSTDTRLYKCCTNDLVETQIDSDAGSNGQDNVSDISMFCPTEDNCKIVYTDDMDTSAPLLKFVDCNDADCSSPTISTIDTDIGASGDQAGADIYCVASDNCKIAYGDDMDTTTPALKVIDCTADEDCSSNTNGGENDTDLGGATTVIHMAIYCPSDTDCKVFTGDDSGDDMNFIDCADAACSNTTDTFRIIDGTATSVPTRVDIDCSAGATDCKLVYQDGDSSPFELNFIDCDDAFCGTAVAANADCAAAGRTCTEVDSDIGTTAGSVPVSIDCVGGATDCKFIYGDTGAGDMFFVDCPDAACTSTGRTITQIDATGGANSLLTLNAALECVSATDCKFIYVGELTSGAEDAYFVDCDDATCSTGSAYDLPGPRFGGDIRCLTSSNCKLTYYDGTTGTNPTVQFGDCDAEDCLPTWSSLTAPWTSVTNALSVSISYDSTNNKLYAHIIKDTTEQGYYKTSDATTISWSSETSYAFSGGDLDNISSPLTGAGPTAIGVSLREATASDYEFASSAVLINVSGTCDQFDRTTDCTDSGAEVIAVAVNGTLQAQTDGTVDGSWQISNVVQPSSGAVITVFVNGEATVAERANAVTKYDGTGDITGIQLYQRHLTIGSDDNQTITNTNLSSYDYSVSSSDADIIFDVDSGSDLALDQVLPTEKYTDETLYILPSNTFQPGAAGGFDVTTHHLEIPASATLTANANTLTVKGSWTNNGTYTCSGNTVKLWSSGFSDTIKSSGNAFCNLSITSSLVAYHKLDEGTSTVANDASGEGLTGTISSTPTWTTGTNANYYGADPGAVTLAASRYITMGDVSPVNFEYNQPFSTSTWFKTTSNTAMTMVSKSFGAAGDYKGWNVQMGPTGANTYLYFQVLSSVGVSNYLEVRTPALSNVYDGNWHHILTTYDGTADVTGVKIYYDGSSQSLTENVGTLSSGSSLVTAPYSIGSRNTTEQFFAGTLDDVRVYKRVLGTTEAADLYAGTHPDEGTYTLVDALDVNNNLTISGGSLDQTSSNYGVTVGGNYLNAANLTTRASSVITMDAASGTNTIQSDASLNNLTLNDGGGSATFQVARQRFISAGNITITGGTFTPGTSCNAASTCAITLGGNFTNSDTFTAGSGTVTFNDAAQTSTLSYSANTTFNNFTVTTSAKTLVFDKDFRTIVSGTFTLTGTSCSNRILLRSESTGTQYELNATGTKAVTFVDVKDSNAITAISATGSRDSGNNTNWTTDDASTLSQQMRHGQWFDACGDDRGFQL